MALMKLILDKNQYKPKKKKEVSVTNVCDIYATT